MRGWASLKLAGFDSGAALAWQARQMVYACRDRLEWTVSIAACLFGLMTAIVLARWLAGRLAGAPRVTAPAGWLRFSWLFVLALFGLLQAFDGRYRDFPLGLFALPCVGYALVGWLAARAEAVKPSLEELFLAFWLPVLAAVVVVQEVGLNPITWLWLSFNLMMALPIFVGRREARLALSTP
jgi:glucan 1,3-beta-glucosidase